MFEPAAAARRYASSPSRCGRIFDVVEEGRHHSGCDLRHHRSIPPRVVIIVLSRRGARRRATVLVRPLHDPTIEIWPVSPRVVRAAAGAPAKPRAEPEAVEALRRAERLLPVERTWHIRTGSLKPHDTVTTTTDRTSAACSEDVAHQGLVLDHHSIGTATGRTSPLPPAARWS